MFIIYIAPKLFALFGLGDFFYKDFRICSVYVFTRKDNRVNWFMNKLFKMLEYLLLYYAGITAVVVMVGLVNNLPILSVEHLLMIFAVTVVLNVMATLVFVLLTNILSLYIGAEMSLALTLLIYAFLHLQAFVKLNSQLQNLLIKLDPVLQPVLPWHDNSFLQKYLKLLDMPALTGFNVWWSLLILGVYLVLVILAGIRVIKTVEITDKI